ncbi:MAG: DegT/DnrJ/EryC1/StrS family aminotransferase [Deltaproteobacteria bacterium]|nr:DegT/DnrJ/EryC1/StrS family aminotransferase [Deltaproteobacteria bacterium]
MPHKKLAIQGGKPLRDQFLPFHRPFIGEEEIAEVTAALRSGWITTGPRTKAFEEKFRQYIGSPHAVGLNSCTAGLHLSLEAAGVAEGDEVITSPITFASTANVIVHQRATPVFVDVEPGTLNINSELIEQSITPRTKAIIPVHLAGHPCDMDEITKIAQQHGLTVIEDAAHALESEYRGKKIGTISPFTAFSFYATKNITTGEGGMLTVLDDEVEEKVRILSLHGISRDAWKRYSDEGYRHWEILYAGYKYNMFDLQAAVGLHQMDRIDQFRENRKKYVTRYNEAFKEILEVEPLRIKPDVKHAHHIYPILLNLNMLTADRDQIMNAIQAENIGIGIHFRAVHLHPFYRDKFGFQPGKLPIAEDASQRILSLPLYPSMSEEDLEDVISVVKKVIAAFQK